MLTIPLPYSATETQECVVKKLSDSWLFLFEMFSNNYMKVKSSKNHLLMSRKSVITEIDNKLILKTED